MAVLTTHEELDFFVEHRPYSKGSLRCLGRGRHINQLAGTKPFGDAVVEAARWAMKNDGSTYPIGKKTRVTVDLSFVFPRPKSTPKWQWPVTRSTGDVDKLCRNVLDALTEAGVFVDDSQVTTLLATKQYAGTSGDGYAHIQVRWSS